MNSNGSRRLTEDVPRPRNDLKDRTTRYREVSARVAHTLEPKRKRSKMSAAQRKAVSARMKKYWAARRKAGEVAAKFPSRLPEAAFAVIG